MTSKPDGESGKHRGARQKILNTANDLFYRNGIRSVGVDTIVEEAGVAKTSLYRWFPTKDDLVVAFLGWRDDVFWTQWDKVENQYQGQPRDELLGQLRWIAAYIDSDDYCGCPFLKASSEFAESDHPVRRAVQANKQQLRDRLRHLSAAVGALDPDLLADQLVLLVDGAFASSRASGVAGPARRLITTAETLIHAACGPVAA